MSIFLITVAVGVIIGIFSGLLGIGGGSMIVPTLRLAFLLPALQATATSLFVVVPTSVAGVIQHLRSKMCVIPVGLASGIGGAITSPLGAQLASMSPSWSIMLATGAAIIYSASTMLRKGFAMPKDSGHTKESVQPKGSEHAKASAQPKGSEHAKESVQPKTSSKPRREAVAYEPASLDMPIKKQILIGGIIGLTVGVAAGYIGLGGGFLMVPLFLTILKVPMKNASATSLLAMCILAVPGVIRHIMLGNIDIWAGIAMSIGSIPGATIGARFVKYVPERTLRILFGFFLIFVALFMVFNEFLLGA